jgi:uncharacterized protein
MSPVRPRPRGVAAYLIALLALNAFAAEPTTEQLLGAFPQSEFTINTPDARQHRFRIWLATSEANRARGLMFVRSLPADGGMLFVHEEPRIISMWMKNTFIPLDMIFIRADGRVTQVEANTKPHSLSTIASREDVVAVLEVNAGIAAKLGIRPGARADQRLLKLAESRVGG